MAVNPEIYPAWRSDNLYNITFEYLDETDIKVTVDGTLYYDANDPDTNPAETNLYTFANATTITFDSGSTPTSSQEIRIYRDTNVDALKSTFFAGSSIRAQDLNKNFEQNNFAVQEIKAYTWDNETATIHSDETWVSSDTQIATTKAMDQRFLDEADEIIKSTDTWVSDDDRVASTAAIDARFQDELSETITSSETWPNNDDTIATTAAIDDRIDLAITNDIGTDGTGITITDDGDGTITLGLGSGSIDLDRIKAADIDISSDTWSNNDTTIATTAKIDDMIDDAITGDILVDSTGLSKTTLGGQTTLGIAAGSVDLDRIKAGDIINLAEQNAGSPSPADTSIFTSSAAAKRFDTLVQLTTPSGSDYQVGKTWLQNDDDLTVSIWNGTGWTAVSSGGAFREQTNVVYVDPTGDDASTGHRISAPKQTIKAAINQINEEIDVELTNGGSGYVEGSYSSVALTGGTGTGLTANITVNASGVVSAVTLTSRTPLVNTYYIGDVLSASNASLGGSGSGLQITVTGDGDGQIVVVAPGVYQELAPIQIKRRNVSIIGQALRSCIVHPDPSTETNNLFELNSGSYLSSMTFTGIKAGSGTGNTLDATLPTTQGWNAAFYNDAFVTKSPYIQNCTNFSDSEINNNALSAHNPAGGAAGDTDSAPTGGGLLINGATPHDDSPLRSMVCDSYTHVALNGPGILVTNNGYCQATSSYAFFNRYHIKCLNGGQANLAASTTDFGDEALVADGRSTTAIFTSNVDGAVTRNVDNDPPIVSFNINEPTADASWFGSATRPQGNMLVDVTHPTAGTVTYPVLSATANTDSEGGNGWTVTISRPNTNNRSINDGLTDDLDDDAAVSFYLRSQIASSGHTMEYVGSGTNYNALPENGGVPVDANQIVESNGGKVWTAITDHNGKFSVGDFFTADQRTGFVSFSAGSVAFDVVTDPTPQLGGDLDVNGSDITGTGNINITGNITLSGTVDGRDVATDGTKLDGIESNATADQTASEIKTAYESNADTNAFTNAWQNKLNGIEVGATADQTAAEIRTLVDSATDSNVFTDADHTKLDGIETGATADQTKADIDALNINADQVDGLEASQFIRADASDSYTGGLFNGEETITAGVGNFNLENGHFWTCGAITIPLPTNGAAGFSGLIRVTAAPTFATGWDFPGGAYTAPTTFPAVAPFYIVDSSTFLLGNWTEGIA